MQDADLHVITVSEQRVTFRIEVDQEEITLNSKEPSLIIMDSVLKEKHHLFLEQNRLLCSG